MGQIASAAVYPRPIWRSERAYVIASVAGVVGLGNLWRFPYIAGGNGGGSFLVAYAISVIVIAIPLAIVESSAGSLVQRTPVGVFRRISARWGPWIGWVPVLVTVGVMSTYFVLTGWTLAYAVSSLSGEYEVFSAFTGGTSPIWYFLGVSALVTAFLLRGVGAIERVSRILLPLLVVIVGGLAIYAQTLEGADEARSFVFGFDTGTFLSPQTWQTAAGQSFYSLGVGQGILIAYGSYVPAGTNVVRSTAIIAGTNSSISIAAALMVFPIVFTFGIAPDAGTELSFTAFPRVFETVEGGALIGIAFFWLLFVAGFTSCLSGALVIVASIRDAFRLPAARSALIVGGVIAVLGIPSALSFSSVGLDIGGKPFLERIDQVTGSGAMVATGLVGAALLAWFLPIRRLTNVMNAGPLRRPLLRPDARWIVYLGRGVPIAVLCWFGITALTG